MTRLELLGWIRSHDMVSVEEMTLSHSSHQPPVPAIRYTNGDQRSILRKEVNEHIGAPYKMLYPFPTYTTSMFQPHNAVISSSSTPHLLHLAPSVPWSYNRTHLVLISNVVRFVRRQERLKAEIARGVTRDSEAARHKLSPVKIHRYLAWIEKRGSRRTSQPRQLELDT